MNTQYLYDGLQTDKRKTAIDATVKLLRKHRKHFDVIAFRGMSGALIAPAVADKLGKGLLMVRKPEDGVSHSSSRVEGTYSTTRYVIVDDFISSGSTVLEIIRLLQETGMVAIAEPFGIVTYAKNRETQFQTNGVTIPVWGIGKVER